MLERGVIVARRKGRKVWNELSEKEWFQIFGNTNVISDLMMQIFICLYHSPDYTDNAKALAGKLQTEYRALNAAVGWAGNKVKDLYNSLRSTKKVSKVSSKMSPWEYVFDGREDEDGTYLWILKENTVGVIRELERSGFIQNIGIHSILDKDISAFGVEGSLFSQTSEKTVDSIRGYLDSERLFFRKSLGDAPKCIVCGMDRLSLIRAVPYGRGGKKNKGLCFCPTHGALFSSYLITFDKDGKLLVSEKLTDDDRRVFGIECGMIAKTVFSSRRMLVHRRVFNREGRSEE